MRGDDEDESTDVDVAIPTELTLGRESLAQPLPGLLPPAGVLGQPGSLSVNERMIEALDKLLKVLGRFIVRLDGGVGRVVTLIESVSEMTTGGGELVVGDVLGVGRVCREWVEGCDGGVHRGGGAFHRGADGAGGGVEEDVWEGRERE
jgi:hypothetical protein